MNMAGRILIADGVATNRITMKVRLASACYEVAATGSGREALALMGSARPQVLLVGACLPDMRPAELCAAIRAAAGPDLPIVVQARGPARIEALRAGASALVEGSGVELTLLARIRGLMRAGPQPDGLGGASYIFQDVGAGHGVAYDFASMADLPVVAPVTLLARKPRGH